jgi:hypothetical protein
MDRRGMDGWTGDEGEAWRAGELGEDNGGSART